MLIRDDIIVMEFKNWMCEVRFGKYPTSGLTYIRLMDFDNGEPIATATTNVTHTPIVERLKQENVIIKNYSENKGMAEALIRSDIVEPTPVGTMMYSDWGVSIENINRMEMPVMRLTQSVLDNDVFQSDIAKGGDDG